MRNRACARVVERSLARMNERRDALGMLGIGEAFKEAIGGAESGKSHLGPVDEGRESLVMAFSGFAEEYRPNRATGTQRFFDEAHAFHANESILAWAALRAEPRGTP